MAADQIEASRATEPDDRGILAGAWAREDAAAIGIGAIDQAVTVIVHHVAARRAGILGLRDTGRGRGRGAAHGGRGRRTRGRARGGCGARGGRGGAFVDVLTLAGHCVAKVHGAGVLVVAGRGDVVDVLTLARAGVARVGSAGIVVVAGWRDVVDEAALSGVVVAGVGR